ncbi:MAG: hypothetical protein KBG15_19180 [Kofleriaceae bacterium]|nr:hypothetical protein [Kofleriaceae bacterium]
MSLHYCLRTAAFALGSSVLTVGLVAGTAMGLATGCGSDSPANGDAPNGSDARIDAPPGATFKVTWGPLTVAPGQEDTRCVDVSVKNAAAIKVHSIHNKLSSGSHHLIVYRDSLVTTESLTPTPCNPFAGTLQGGAVTPIMVTQKKDDSLTLPDGVAYTFAANQFIRLEMHFINTTDAPIEITATSEFVTMPAADVKNEADFLFMGTPDIDIAIGQTQTVRRFLRMPAFLSNANIFAITGHTHKMGTDMQVGYSSGYMEPVTSVYKPAAFNWDEPETTFATPPFRIPADGGFDFQCSYTNTSGARIRFGESANDEMCFFWAYYYPSVGSRVCAVTTQVGGPEGYSVCCPDPANQAICDRLLGN